MLLDYYHHYDIAYKKRGMERFEIVTPPPYGWVADPFLVEFKGEMYLFAEVFLWRSERNGKIGYCKWEGDAFGEWTITMDRHWHLSYPNVWVENDHLYMVPESYQLGEVVLYELVEFPDKWRKVKSILSDVGYCDTTFLHDKSGDYLFTFERRDPSPEGTGLMYKKNDAGEYVDKIVLSDSLDGSRCGGNFFKKNGKWIRVGQDCTKEYGGGLVFFEVDSIYPEYKEHVIKRIGPENLYSKWQKKYRGIHTYNKCGDFRVIDLRRRESMIEEEIASRRVKKVFTNKYRY